MNGSVITPMNWFIALKVDCCDPVAVSPAACDRPFADTAGSPTPVALSPLAMTLMATSRTCPCALRQQPVTNLSMG